MSEPNLRTVFQNYLDAFSAESTTRQEELLRASVAEEVIFSNPGVSGRGLSALHNHIAGFQQRFKGSYFRVNWFRQQHGQVLAEWTQFNSDGTEFVTANSYAKFDVNGRIVQFAGFWD